MVTEKEIKELYEFLDADLPSKIFPNETINGEEWTRDDYFKEIAEVREYLKQSFQSLIPKLKETVKS